MFAFVRRGAGVWLALAACVGCENSSGTVTVEGTVKLDGRPLADATVQFLAQDPGGRDATGTTNADGVFRLSTFKPRDGARPGKYKVVIQPPSATAPPAASMEEAQAQKGARTKAVGLTVPPRYSRPDQTVLTQDVPPSSPVVFDLQSR